MATSRGISITDESAGRMETFLVQVLLPINDNRGRPFPAAFWRRLKRRLVARFGGVTAFTRAPAEGVWSPASDHAKSEDVCIVEVMVKSLDQHWWDSFRAELEKTLAQERVVIRAIPFIEI